MRASTSFSKKIVYKYNDLVITAARQLAGRRPLYFTADVSILLLTLLFFSPTNLGGLWADRHQTLPYVRWWLYFIKLRQKFGGPSTKKLAAQKYQNFWRDFGLRDLVHRRRKIGPPFRPTQATISDAHYSGANRRCPLKISQFVKGDQRLLMHTSLGMELPPTML